MRCCDRRRRRRDRPPLPVPVPMAGRSPSCPRRRSRCSSATRTGRRGVVRVPWPEGDWPVDAVLDAVDGDTRMVAVVSPNNPTGSRGERRRARAWPRASRRAVVVDLAYAEFADEDLTRRAAGTAQRDRAAHHVQGVGSGRAAVGFALGRRRIARAARRRARPTPCRRSPSRWPAPPSQTARGAMESTRRSGARRARGPHPPHRRTGTASAPVAGELRARPWPRPGALADGLAGLGIKIRRGPATPARTARAPVAVPAEARLRSGAWTRCSDRAAPEALLLDMDGVIADVGESYREAIRADAAEFDVRVMDRAASPAMKAAGKQQRLAR